MQMWHITVGSRNSQLSYTMYRWNDSNESTATTYGLLQTCINIEK